MFGAMKLFVVLFATTLLSLSAVASEGFSGQGDFGFVTPGDINKINQQLILDAINPPNKGEQDQTEESEETTVSEEKSMIADEVSLGGVTSISHRELLERVNLFWDNLSQNDRDEVYFKVNMIEFIDYGHATNEAIGLNHLSATQKFVVMVPLALASWYFVGYKSLNFMRKYDINYPGVQNLITREEALYKQVMNTRGIPFLKAYDEWEKIKGKIHRMQTRNILGVIGVFATVGLAVPVALTSNAVYITFDNVRDALSVRDYYAKDVLDIISTYEL